MKSVKLTIWPDEGYDMNLTILSGQPNTLDLIFVDTNKEEKESLTSSAILGNFLF